MQYTFEVTVCGCNTFCRHCYVSGGPGPHMPYARFALLAEKLAAVLNGLPGDVSVTLGNELPNHPEATRLIETARELLPVQFSFADVGLTSTGIALARRPDRERVIEAYRAAGAQNACLTLHGVPERHNALVANPDAFSSVRYMAEAYADIGLPLYLSLMMNRCMAEEWDEFCRCIERIPHTESYIVIPLFLPLGRLRGFEPMRADYRALKALAGRLARAGLDEEQFMARVEEGCEEAIARRVRQGFSWRAAERECPDWAFFHIDGQMDLYFGNAGAHTRRIGSLLTDSAQRLREEIASLPANYDYSAYYDLDSLPPAEEIVCPSARNLVYSEVACCLYSWLDRRGIAPLPMEQGACV